MFYKNIDAKILIFLISLCAGFVFLLTFGQHGITGDAGQYDIIARNLVLGHGYSLDIQAPYKPTNLREPAYILFLCFIYKLFGCKIMAVYIIQILLFSVSCILIFLITKNIFNARVAKYTAFLTAICPTLADYTIFLYSESFFIFLLVFSVYSILKAKETQSIKWYIVAGLAMASIALCKVAMLFFVVPSVFYLFFNKKSIKIILFFLVFSIPVVLWGLRNYSVYGTFNLTNRGDALLLANAYRVEYSFQKMKEMATYSFSEYLGSKLFPDPKIKPKDFQFQDLYRVRSEYQELINQGMNEADIDRLMRRKAISIIRNHPVRYLVAMPVDFFRLMLFMYIPSLNDENVINMFKNIKGGEALFSAIKGLYKMLSFVILLFVIVGIYFRKIQWRKEFMILAVIVYINLVYGILGGYQRYSVPLIPFYFIFATVGAMTILKKDIYSKN